ncbi:MAG: hypothetical protein COA58_08635 [Bacteroidetes bacterium]|nr:MAG: hypothetical protein COA58_08635 [Bacteroidota bacterium]
MLTKSPILLTLLLCIFSFSANAYVLEGKIVSTSGSGIAYATINVQNTSLGTYSDINGEFALRLDAGTYELEIRSIGYQPIKRRITITGNTQNYKIAMETTASEIGEVVIGSDKAALTRKIMEKVKVKRQSNVDQINSSIVQVYAKYALIYGKENEVLGDTSNKYQSSDQPELIESYSQLFYTYPNNYKEIKLGYRDYRYTSSAMQGQASVSVSATIPGQRENAYGTTTYVSNGPNPFLFVLNKQTANFDLYQNSLYLPDLSQNPYVSPIGNSNFLVYNFMLVGSYFENDKKVLRIKVTPKNSNANAFSGHLLIEDESFALIGASLTVNPKALLFHNKFSFILQYQEVQGVFTLKSEEYTYHTKAESRKIAFGTSLLLYDSIEVNPEISPKFMRQGAIVYSDSALKKEQDYWSSVRPSNLKTKEIAFITQQDSARNYESSIEYLNQQDSIINHISIWDITLNGIQHINRPKGTSWFFGSALQSIRPFAVGGYRQALITSFTKEWTKANRLNLTGEINYGFRNKNIKGDLAAKYTYAPKKFGSFTVRGGDDYARLNDYESIEGTFSRSNYLQKFFYGIGAAYELTNGLMLKVDLDYASFRAINNIELAPWSEDLFGPLNIPKNFEGYNQLVASFLLTFVPYQKYELTEYKKIIMGSRWPEFNLRYKKGIKPFGNSDVNYDFVQLNVRKEVSLKSLGESKFEVFTGKFINSREIRLADKKFFRGSDAYFFSDPLRSFQLLGPTLITTNAFFQGHYLHQFNGALLNKVPFIKRLKLQSLGGAGILLLDDQNYRHTELYAGLARAFRIRSQLFKITGVYATSENSVTGLNSGFKIGLDFYNTYTKKWSY